jgi:hypothetical protein
MLVTQCVVPDDKLVLSYTAAAVSSAALQSVGVSLCFGELWAELRASYAGTILQQQRIEMVQPPCECISVCVCMMWSNFPPHGCHPAAGSCCVTCIMHDVQCCVKEELGRIGCGFWAVWVRVFCDKVFPGLSVLPVLCVPGYGLKSSAVNVKFTN